MIPFEMIFSIKHLSFVHMQRNFHYQTTQGIMENSLLLCYFFQKNSNTLKLMIFVRKDDYVKYLSFSGLQKGLHYHAASRSKTHFLLCNFSQKSWTWIGCVLDIISVEQYDESPGMLSSSYYFLSPFLISNINFKA